MSGHEPWDYAGDTPEPSFFEKIIVILMTIFSALFFRPKKRK
jgi:hypothetical protein